MVSGSRVLAGHSQGELPVLEQNGVTWGALWSSCGGTGTVILALRALMLLMKGQGALEEVEPILGKS